MKTQKEERHIFFILRYEMVQGKCAILLQINKIQKIASIVISASQFEMVLTQQLYNRIHHKTNI